MHWLPPSSCAQHSTSYQEKTFHTLKKLILFSSQAIRLGAREDMHKIIIIYTPMRVLAALQLGIHVRTLV